MDQVTIPRELLRQAIDALDEAEPYVAEVGDEVSEFHFDHPVRMKWKLAAEQREARNLAAQVALQSALDAPAVEPSDSDRVMTVVYYDPTKEDVQAFMDHPKAKWFGWCHAPYQRDEARYKLDQSTAPQAQQPAPDTDIPDLIAGTLGVSRGTAYDLMRESLPAPVQEPEIAGYVNPTSLSVMRIGEFDWIKLYPDNAGGHIPLYTSHHPDKAAKLEAANTNLFEQGQKMHKRIQELERDCKIGVSAMLEYCEEIDRLKAQQPAQEPVAWCQLGLSGKSIAYFDGDPMIMTGPVGNEHHPTPLYTAQQPRKADESAYQRGYMDGMAKPCPDCADRQPRKAVKLSDSDVAAIVKEAAKGSAMRRDGSTSERIARAIEQAVWAKLGVTE